MTGSMNGENTHPMASPGVALRQVAEGADFEPPSRLLGDLSAQQALVAVPGAPYSVARVVAHMQFWQGRWHARIRGGESPLPAGNNPDWPPVAAEAWPGLVADFLASLDAFRGVATQNPEALERRVRDDETVGDTLTKVAVHNAYHLGQIALLRQLQNLWPPENGDDTWE